MLDKKVSEFKAIADETRIRLLILLKDKELCVCDLENVLQISQSSVSQHLNKLKNAGLIKEHKSGKWKYFSVSEAGKQFLEKTITEILTSLHKDITVKNDTKRLKKHKSCNC